MRLSVRTLMRLDVTLSALALQRGWTGCVWGVGQEKDGQEQGWVGR